MSFNPCPASAPPSWYPGEGLLVTADNVEFSLSLGRLPPRQSKATCKAKGRLHLTNIRLLFIATKPTASPVPGGPEFASFDVPLRGIVDVKFNQPIFGANNLQGKVTPVSCLEASAPVEWKAAFIAGGTTVLIPTLLRLMDQLHREAQGQAIPAQQLRTPQQQPHHGQPPQPQPHAPQQQQPCGEGGREEGVEEGREGGVEKARGVGKEKGKEGKRCTWGTLEEHQATATYTNPMPHASAPPPSSGSSFNPPAYSGFSSGR
ncbi:arabinogalactan protein [Nannochloropsis gaditana CCMP526]|uniref:arabinogalactan protein n=1 Tax=Nannochloropsis gaditana (strain CCMP526) TaxID=1093141 RepID=UPI00029F6974|nr:arabinogalactan protein [Nannochloropsis gaditana CCMP526]EKU21709.1 arabinogalactan protein [Nannochloropsis gaditana CCMP526]|eukprot:XP_005854652.1 arabinogalactan protein [Nannochloropsis gaditana CCMP526]